MISHFVTLQTMREDLAVMGQPLNENNFYTIILGSLPQSYDPYISTVNATSSVLGKTISADNLMLTVTGEYEHQNLKNKTGKKDNNVAFYSNNSEKGEKGGSCVNSKKKNITYHSCHKKGHYKSECWAPGGGKEGQGPKQKGKGKVKRDEKKDEEGSGASAEMKKKKGKEKEVEEAWLAMIYIESKDEWSMSEEGTGDDEFHWSDFNEPEDPIDTVNHSADPCDVKELTSDCDNALIPFGVITDPVPDDGTYTITFGSDELAGSADT